MWQRTWAVHARTQAYRRRIDGARRVIDAALEQTRNWGVMWSAGKDSTVMTHMLRREGLEVVSEKDDLDYPGEREYVQRLAAEWGLRLRIISPSISPAAWIAANSATMMAGHDIHSRAAGLSKACFYGLMREASATYDGIFLGLRAAESRARKTNRNVRGSLYRRANCQWTCTPIADLCDQDIYAYALEHGVELLSIYRCIGLMHRDEPGRVRKSWWLPGDSASDGSVVWLRRYYPSLYRQMLAWFPVTAGTS